MHDPQELSQLNAACRWSVFFAARAPRPLFAAPGYLFRLSQIGQPATPRSDRFLSRYEALKQAPEQLMQRTVESAPLSNGEAVVLCYALNGSGDIHAEPEQLPQQLLVYLHIPSSETYTRRLLCIDPSARQGLVLPDRLLPFDLHFLPDLSASADHDPSLAMSKKRVH